MVAAHPGPGKIGRHLRPAAGGSGSGEGFVRNLPEENRGVLIRSSQDVRRSKPPKCCIPPLGGGPEAAHDGGSERGSTGDYTENQEGRAGVPRGPRPEEGAGHPPIGGAGHPGGSPPKARAGHPRSPQEGRARAVFPARGKAPGPGLTPPGGGGILRVLVAGWSSLVARRAHNPKVAGSNPAPAMQERSAASGGVSALATGTEVRRLGSPVRRMTLARGRQMIDSVGGSARWIVTDPIPGWLVADTWSDPAARAGEEHR